MLCFKFVNYMSIIEVFLFPLFPNQLTQVHPRKTGVGLLGKFGQIDRDLQSDMPRKPTKKALLPPIVDFLGKTVHVYIFLYFLFIS